MMIMAGFASCGGNGDETTLPKATGVGDDDTGRNSVKDSVPEDLKLNGETMIFFVRDDNEYLKNEMDVEKTTNDTLFDAIYYRNTTVEDRLGVEISQISQACPSSNSETWNSTLRNAVLTKSGDYDAAAIYGSQSSALAVEGLYYNVLDLPHLELSKPWWNQSIVDELTLFDTLYFLAGDICVTEIAEGIAFFFNKDMFAEFFGSQNIDIYQVVRDQKWTIDYMIDLVSNVWVDENSDGVISDGDVVGFSAASNMAGAGYMDCWVAAMDIKLTTMVDGYPELTFYNEHTVEAFEKVQKLYINNPGTLRAESISSTSFKNGTQMFNQSILNSGDGLRDMQDDYGVLPIPKFDEEQDDYHGIFHNSASLIVVLSTCQAPEKVGATLELMSAEGYKQVTPAYFEICLQGKYSDEPADAEMYDRIIKSFVYSFGFCYSTKSLEGIGSLFRDIDADIAQRYEQNKIKYQTSLETLIDKLDEISFMVG
jgi:hypothetical protein